LLVFVKQLVERQSNPPRKKIDNNSHYFTLEVTKENIASGLIETVLKPNGYQSPRSKNGTKWRELKEEHHVSVKEYLSGQKRTGMKNEKNMALTES